MKTSILPILIGLFSTVCLQTIAQTTEPASAGATSGGFEVNGSMQVQKNLQVADSAFVGKYLYVNGKLGIGMATPEVPLHVIGDAKVEGNIRANKLYVQSIEVANGTQGTPFSFNENLFVNGSIGVGTNKIDGYKLSVNGKIRCSDIIKVYPEAEWADYVFLKSYKLRPLAEVEKYIQKHGHLPEIPSAEEVKKEGIDLGSMDAKLLQKIEELTLYMIELKKENEQLKKEMRSIQVSKK